MLLCIRISLGVFTVMTEHFKPNVQSIAYLDVNLSGENDCSFAFLPESNTIGIIS